ncbi:MAG: hypothetical protein GKR90_23375 [Pseudomonadales bacterium]|nr:hypothetical protein [Pseudomonadales bacterium]
MSNLEAQIKTDIIRWDELEVEVEGTSFGRSFPSHRRTGSAGDLAADRWLIEELLAVGLAAEIQTYPFERFVIEECWIEFDGDRIPAVPMYDTTAMDLYLDGKIGPDIEILTCTPQEGQANTKAVLASRAAANHKAIVAISAATTVAPGLALVNSESYRNPCATPVFQVSSDHADKLLRALPNQHMTCRLGARREPSTATNVSAFIPGRSGGKPWVVMTPKSCWWTSTAERVGGLVIWLALARKFAAKQPDRGIIFSANSGHELSHLGMDYFLNTLQTDGVDIDGWLHLGANFASGQPPHLQASSHEDFDRLTGAMAQQNILRFTQTPIGNRPVGEARNIHGTGARYFSIVGGNPYFHHPDDRYPDCVDLTATSQISRAILNLMSETLG